MGRGARTTSARLGLLTALVALALGTLFSATAPAQKIVEAHASGGGYNGYTELQFTADGQGALTGKHLVLYSPAGTVLSDLEFAADVPEGGSQRTALIANGLTLNGQPVDYPVMAGPQAGTAAVCLTATDPFTPPVTGIDCIGYGAAPIAQHNPSPFGTPALSSSGLQAGQTLQRTLARGCATALDEADDGNDSAADFALGSPSPRDNGVIPTERICPPKPKCKKKKAKGGAEGAKKKKKCRRKRKKK